MMWIACSNKKIIYIYIETVLFNTQHPKNKVQHEPLSIKKKNIYIYIYIYFFFFFQCDNFVFCLFNLFIGSLLNRTAKMFTF